MAALSLAVASGSFLPTTAQEALATYDIEGATLAQALREFAQVSGAQIIFTEEIVNGRPAPALRGDYALSEALEILLAGSGLRAERTPGGAIMIVEEDAARRESGVERTDLNAPTGGPIRQEALARGGAESLGPETITVTGTRLRGGPPTAPVRIVTRTEIDQSGYLSLGEVIRSLPENFGGGANPGHVGSPAANENRTNASTVNLRGLGDGATLVLLNGRRLPPETSRQSADISGIPMSAVERVEVVKDGSSAIYGSDAVAGVVNFILRSDYEGAEVSARAGVATQGGGTQRLYSALVGRSREDWRALLSAELGSTEEISTRDRDYTSTAPNIPLSREEDRASLFLNAGGRLAEGVTIDLDALWSRRETNYRVQARQTATPVQSTYDVPGYVVGGTVGVELPADWLLRVNGSVSHLRQDNTNRRPTGVSESFHESKSDGLEAAFDGKLPLDIGAAFGLGVRNESYLFQDSTETRNLSHDIQFAFGELLIPVVPASNNRNGLQELDVNLSARHEDYSDFGRSTTPRIGVRYVPFDDVVVRASWGESFKAPSFTQVGLVRAVQILPATSLGGPAGRTALFASGGNPDLKPEQSTSWTLGADYAQPDLSDLVLSASYFNIDYTDRVVTPVSPIAGAMSNPIFADFLILNPTPDAQAAVIADVNPSMVFNNTGAPYDPASVVVMLLNHNTNAASMTAEGVDLAYRQTFESPFGAVSPFANATWIELHQQTLPTAVEFQLSGVIHNVPDWRVRGGLNWSVGGFIATGAVNYQAGSQDTGVTPNREVASWTTVDANFAYTFSDAPAALEGVQLTLSVQNLFDRDPPYAASPALLNQGIFFDSVNASAIGQYVSIGIRKAF